MPNTLAHIGLQTPLTKIGLKKAPLQWIALGCIIPDIPWIVQRIFFTLADIAPITLRLYAVTQASLLFCAILCLTFALFTRKPLFVFLILFVNSFLHLIFDACQTKWGNGVNFMAPFSWQTSNFGFFWPEDSTTYVFTFIGIAVFILCWSKTIKTDLLLQRPNKKKTAALLFLLLFYFTSPILFTAQAYDADLHYSKTLLNHGQRSGKKVEIDRGSYNNKTQTISCYADNALNISNPPAISSGNLSIRGIFKDEKSIIITEYHTHKQFRDQASYAGLILTLMLWLHSLLRLKYPPTNHKQQ